MGEQQRYAISVRKEYKGQRDLRDALALITGERRLRLLYYFDDDARIEAAPEQVEQLRALAGAWLDIEDDG